MADVSVRPAVAGDVPEIARIQLLTWRTAYRRIVPRPVLDAVGEDEAVASWRSAVGDPPSPRHHVLVAQEQEWVVGFAALGPADDEDSGGAVEPAAVGAVATMLVEPRWGRRGHGSRLLAAAVDHLRADDFRTAVTWVFARDKASTKFYESAGWEPDGASRALDMNGTYVDEIRLHTALV